MRHEAIYATHPNVVRIDDSYGAFDSNDTLVAVNEDLVSTKIAELQAAEPLRLLRLERNQILQQSDWEVQRNTERNITDSNLIDYRNALRDLPQEIENGNISAPTLDENGMLVFEHWPNRYEINIEDEPTANNSANTV